MTGLEAHKFIPHPEAELEDDGPEDPKWDEPDPRHTSEEEIIRRADERDDLYSDRRDRRMKTGCRWI